MCRAHAWPTLKTPETFVLHQPLEVLGGKSSSGARCCTPALLTRMSIGPIVASNASIAAATAAWSVTSKARLLGARDLRGGRGELLLVAAVEHDRRAGLGEPARERQADALGGAGDQRAPAGEVEQPARHVVIPDQPGNRVRPPSTRSTWPWMNFACGPARKATASAISSGSA